MLSHYTPSLQLPLPSHARFHSITHFLLCFFNFSPPNSFCTVPSRFPYCIYYAPFFPTLSHYYCASFGGIFVTPMPKFKPKARFNVSFQLYLIVLIIYGTHNYHMQWNSNSDFWEALSEFKRGVRFLTNRL